MVEATKLISSEENIHFIIVGDGRKKTWIEDQIKKYNLEKVLILTGRYDIKYMPSFYKAADCLLLCLKDDETMNLTVPAKLQAYMTGGKPIVAMINGDANELINEIKCGIAVEASKPDKLADAIRQIKSMSEENRIDMGKRGKKYCEDNFNKTTILNNLYNRIFNS